MPSAALPVRCLAAFLALAIASAEQCTDKVTDASDDQSAMAIFNKRTLPIFQSAKPSSCTECHLSGVELKDYIRPDQAQTFASLVEADLVDVKSPDRSKILQFIARRPDIPT